MIPQWNTTAGNLDIAVFSEQYNTVLSVFGAISVNVVAGELPPGLYLVEDLSHNQILIQGTPDAVSTETTWSFTLRASNTSGVMDRAFSITVTGEIPPGLPGISVRNLGTYDNWTWIDADLQSFDLNTTDILTYTLIGGNLPPGLSLTPTGRIQGYVNAPQRIEVEQIGYDDDLFDSLQIDGTGILPGIDPVVPNRTYQFTILVDDGKIPSSANYSITIYLWTNSAPVLLNRDTLMAVVDLVPEGIYFDYHLIAQDFQGKQIGFEAIPSSISTINHPLPANLLLSSSTGWINGYIDNSTNPLTVASFVIRTYAVDQEPNLANYSVDYGTQLPYNILQGRTYSELKALGFKDFGTGFDNKTLVFLTQTNYLSYYIDKNGYLWTTVGDGWGVIASDKKNVWKFSYDPVTFTYNLVPGIHTVPANTMITAKYLCSLPIGQGADQFYTKWVLGSTEYTQWINSTSRYWYKEMRLIGSNALSLRWTGNNLLGSIYNDIPSTFSVSATTDLPSVITYTLADSIEKISKYSYNNTRVIELTDVDDLVVGLKAMLPGFVYNQAPYITSIDTVHNRIVLNDGIDIPQNGTVIQFMANHTEILPDGLTLDSSSGMIMGRTSHTVSGDYAFVVKASAGTDSIVRAYTITTESITDYPCSNFSLEFLLEDTDLANIRTALSNFIDPYDIYRYNDSWWGLPASLRLPIAYGVGQVSDDTVELAVSLYHHKKQCSFLDMRWAQCLGNDGNVLYEVIYARVLDQYSYLDSSGNIIYQQGVIAGTPYLYPASIPNMQTRLAEILGSSDQHYIPGWMSSLQPDGNPLGYTAAIPLVYLRPGKGKAALYKLQQNLNISTISTTVDRYVWDQGQTDLAYDLVDTHAKYVVFPKETIVDQGTTNV